MKLLFCLLLLIPIMAFSQSKFTFSGKVISVQGESIALANITLDKHNKYAVAKEDGSFQINRLNSGDYVVTISAIGFKTINQNITINSNMRMEFVMREEVQNLKDVTVVGKTEAREISEKAITISSLDVKIVADQALGAEEVLKTSTGIVVRQNGGLGSSFNINLNGLTGQAVRIYYDGIPVQVFGGGIQLNNIPVDALERIDVYKGVIPIDIGTDALGGGINLVPLQLEGNYLRTSYSVGSFNTHRFTFNGQKSFNESIAVSVLSYFNYSDNDYSMSNIPNLVETLLPDGSVGGVTEERIDTRRFHDQHTSAYIEGALKIKNVSWADRLELTSSFSHRFDEIQQGTFIINTSVGEAEREVNTFAQRLNYKKKLFKDKLNLRYHGVLSLAKSQTRDSTTSIFNWRGERLLTPNNSGSEIFSIPTLREGRDLGTAHRFNAGYSLRENVVFTISDFYSYSRIKGDDPVGIRLDIDGQSLDPNTIPSRLNRNIFGAELKTELFKEKITAIAFYKNYDYKAESIDILQVNATLLPVREVQNNNNGYGFALKYQMSPKFFIRSSFEKAIRIPNENEVFGDFGAILPNFTLRPENSNNLNLGVSFESQVGNDKFISLKVDGFLRDQEDLIRLDQFGPENSRFINEDQVDGMGIEVSTRMIPWNNLRLSGNFTYQSNEIGSNGDLGSEGSVGVQVPNIPQLFYNLGANYTFNNLFGSSNSLDVFWTYFFTDRFSINEVQDLDTANPDFIIPEQNIHNAGLTYVLDGKGLSFSLNIQNIFDSEIFDNFRIPRPGINYAFKINYSL